MASDNTEITLNKILQFDIAGYSSYSSSYEPRNIIVNKPEDQSSRWSSESNTPPQFILLKLRKPSIVQSILFGKFDKGHVCNLKKFKIYGGLHENCMIELLDGGLKNDSVPEEFLLRFKIDDNMFPCNFIKIVPLQSWGTTFNFSIWFIELKGSDKPDLVQPCMNWYNEYREREAIRLCLKHFRQHNYTEAYEALEKRTKISLEHPALTELHSQLVINGKFEECERMIEKAIENGWFNSYIGNTDYQTQWSQIEYTCMMMIVDKIQARVTRHHHQLNVHFLPRSIKCMNGCFPTALDGSIENWPGMRGGHQMCIDPISETIYLFGGWDGSKDLADFWSFDVKTQTWTCLSKNTEEQGGPCARSCHKICIDHVHKQIFTLGRYLDQSLRTNSNLHSDFYLYDIETAKWILITDDTSAMGGPSLIFDHQMAIDVECQTIYVFGGRVLGSSGSGDDRNGEPSFSSLYSYHIPTNTWKQLRSDQQSLRSRVGHTMLFHPRQRCLYIFAGQRNKEYLNDLQLYDIEKDSIRLIADGACKEITKVSGAGFTQRATIDPDLNEIHVLTAKFRIAWNVLRMPRLSDENGEGMNKDREKHDAVQNSLFVYSIDKNKWSCVYTNDNDLNTEHIRAKPFAPLPRYAHQLVYDSVNKRHYLFGGNPGRDNQLKMRLDDFWCLKLCRPTHDQLLQECRFLIRKHHYLELTRTDSASALHYLQTEVFATVDHSNPTRKQEFELLPTLLFKSALYDDDQDNSSYPDVGEPRASRNRLFNTLIEYFPDDMTQPKANIVDLILLH